MRRIVYAVSLAVLFAGGELRAEAPEVMALRPPARAGIVRPTPIGVAGRAATESLPKNGIAPSVCCGNLTYHGDFPYDGDAVQHAQKVYTIFWAPPGTSFPSGYQSTVNQFVQDLSGTSYYAIGSQYYDDAGNIGTAVTLAGTWLDTTSTMGSSIADQDILDEVTRAQNANGWSNDANSYFQVYTPSNVTSTEFCGWHSYEFNAFSPNRAFGLILYPRATSTGTCLQSSPWPNGQIVDAAINVSAHEIMETVTDPYGDGWYYLDGTGEIGDLCNQVYGTRDRNLGSNALLNGHPYLIQQEWSNAASNCAISYGALPSITGVSPNPVTGSASAQTITINGTGFVNKPWITVTWSGGAKVLTSSEVTYVSSTQVKMSIATTTAADSWTVKVTNPNGASSNIAGFSVTGGSSGAPSVTTGGSSSITQTSATVSGTVNPNGSATTVYFDYGTSTSYGSTATYGSIGSGTSSVTPSFNLTNLACGTTYQYRARATNGSGTTSGTNQSFTTSSCSQPSTTELISNGSFASGSASWALSGSFYADSRFTNCRTCPGYAYLSNSDGSAGDNLAGAMYQTVSIPANATSATLSFWYNIATQETTGSIAYDVLNVTVQNTSGSYLGTIAVLSNLNKTTGYVQASASLAGYAGQTVRINFLGTTDSSLPTVFRVDDVSLLVTASAAAPSVTTGGASSIGQTSATVSATVNPNGSSTTLYFDYGTTTSYGNAITYGNVGSGTSGVGASAGISGLSCGTTYQYRARAQNGGGSTNGANQSFTTSACSATPPTISLSSTSLTFNATAGGSNPPPQSVTIANIGGGTLNWTASAGASWIGLSAASGTAPSTLTISVNSSGMAAGSSSAAFVTISASGATNTPAQITVTINIAPTVTAKTHNDFNGDHKSDIVWRNTSTGDIDIWFLGGHQISGGGYVANLPSPQWSVSGAGDFSGDGKADLLLRDNATGNIWIWFINGNAISGGGYVANLPPQFVCAGIGDFNNDGKADILWRDNATGNIWIWLMNGNAINGGGYVANLPAALVAGGVGDFNNDGKADILWRNTATGDIWIWLMNGNAIAGGGHVASLPTTLVPAGVGDFNADGKADILWRNTATGELWIWLMNGNAIAGGGYVANLPATLTAASIGDFDGDGRADILWRNTSTGDNYIWLMNANAISGGGYLATLPPPVWVPVSP